MSEENEKSTSKRVRSTPGQVKKLFEEAKPILVEAGEDVDEWKKNSSY